LDALVSPSKKSPLTSATATNSNTSFAQQLAESLESYLGTASAGSHLQIDISPQQGPNSGTRQFIVTLKDADEPAGTPVAAKTVAAPAKIDVSGMLMYSGIPEPPPVAATGPIEEPITNEVDAYWAAQPEEVRVLRTIQDWTERGEKGLELSQKGFAIDPNIMLHGWDPYMTMKGRLEEGYTWVPAVGQDGIPLGPGLSFPGLPRYDPKNPPPGAILVSVDFAKGLEHTSIGARPAHPGDPAVS